MTRRTLTVLSVVCVRRALYAVGGRNDTTYLDSVEKYDLALCTWSSVAPLPKPLRCMTAVSYHGKLYVFGGESTTEIVNTAYRSLAVSTTDP